MQDVERLPMNTKLEATWFMDHRLLLGRGSSGTPDTFKTKVGGLFVGEGVPWGASACASPTSYCRVPRVQA